MTLRDGPANARIAIVNRGDAALRALQAIRDHNLEHDTALRTIALHTEAERHALWVRLADESVSLGPALHQGADGRRVNAYLDLDGLSRALVTSRSDAAWVGWGLVSEMVDFAELCERLGVRFIGPSSAALGQLGDKLVAKELAESLGVAVVPWSKGAVTADTADAVAATIGFPLLVKATAGGGGRGIRTVDEPAALAEAVQRAAAEALSAFGDATVILERKVVKARHLEVQVAADASGTVWIVGVRDCTLQRRRQKVVEEAGPAVVDEALGQRLADAAASLIRAADYTGLATVEFLFQPHDGALYFMEVNPRLQVEHTVTEAVTGTDLVRLQLDLAWGVPVKDEPCPPTAHAIEARVTAENPLDGFRPSPGRLSVFRPATGPGVRIDTGLQEGDVIPAEFDPLIVKVIATGADREQAYARLRRALRETRIVVEGGATNLGFLRSLLALGDVARRDIHVAWLDDLDPAATAPDDAATSLALVLAAVELAAHARREAQRHLLSTAARGRPEADLSAGRQVGFAYRGRNLAFIVHRTAADGYVIETGDGAVRLDVEPIGAVERVVRLAGATWYATVLTAGSWVQVDLDGNTYRMQSEEAGVVRTPSAGVVVAVRVEPGQTVAPGDILVVLESMKLETSIRAEQAGVVREVSVTRYAQVDAGDALVAIEPSGDDDALPASGAEVSFAPLAAGADAPDAPEPFGVVDRMLAGFDPGPLPDGFLRTAFARTHAGDRAARADLVDAEVAILERFVELATLTSREGSREGPGGRVLSDLELLHAFMRAPDRMAESLPAQFVQRLSRALSRLGAPSLESGAALSEALFRLMRAREALPRVADVVVQILRGWLDTPAAALVDQRADLRELLGYLSADVDPQFGRVSDAARAATHELFVRPTVAATRPDTTQRAGAAPLEERLELWRYRHFDLEHLLSSADCHLYRAVGREHPSDRRLLVIAEVDDLTPAVADDGTTETIPTLEAVLLESFGLIRSWQVRRTDDGPSVNRVIVYARPPWTVTDDVIERLSGRLVQAARNLGLDKVLLRVRRPDPDSGALVERLIHVGEPQETGAWFGETAPSDEPVRPLSPRGQRLLRLRERGLHDPYEVLQVLTSRGTRVSRFAPGRFTEYDFDEQQRLVPVERPDGGNAAGIVVGRIENYTRLHPEGMQRVILLGDPGRDLGALAEPECRRIVAGIDLAEELGVPVEWFAVSAGARVSMTSGTENLDWVARVLRRIVTFTQRGGEINIVVTGVNVGAQPYFNAEATMLMHTKGILVMLPNGAMVLTGKRALDFAGGVSAEDDLGIGGYERVMGPNGQAQFWAPSIEAACGLLFRHYGHTYVAPGEQRPRRTASDDPHDRDVSTTPHPRDGFDFATVGEVFSDRLNPDRKKPFQMRSIMRAVIDSDCQPFERWTDMADAEGVVTWEAHLGGHAVALIGIESHAQPRLGATPADGPRTWSGATLFPRSSKKLARALNAASGRQAAVILASLAGFDGSPESLRELQLEYGAEIGRAITNFDGPVVFCVVSRYHGGGFVVFSKHLNDRMQVLAIQGSQASVIGGSAAAGVVFVREIERRVREHPQVAALRERVQAAAETDRLPALLELESAEATVRTEVRTELAREFDAIHSVQRALEVDSVDQIITPGQLRPALIAAVERGHHQTEGPDVAKDAT